MSRRSTAIAKREFRNATSSWSRSYELVLLLLVLIATVVAYSPSLRGRQIWDDEAHITAPELQSLSGLYRIWFEVGATQQYYPLLHSAFWLEHKLWGDSVFGYHLINLAWHLVAVLLLYLILKKLKVPGALLAAAIFALHPIMVESVAWMSEQKNTLSAVFYLSAMLLYLEFDQSRRHLCYIIALGLFVLGLLTKTVTATLPAALLVIFWWQRGTLSWKRDIVPLLPFFMLGAIAGAITAWVERKLIGAEGAGFEMSLVERGLLAGRVIWFYLSKLFWPANLIFNYPRWQIDPGVWWQWLFPVAALAVLVLFWGLRSKTRGPLAGWLLFVGTLVPVLGFLNVYPFVYSFVADHFQYLASLGIIVSTAAAIALVLDRLPQTVRRLGFGLCVLVVAILGLLTWRQSRMYADLIALYQSTIDRNPNSWMAQNNLGITLHKSGNVDDAIEHFRTAIRIRPNNANALANLGSALADTGQFEQALAHLHESIRIQPNHLVGHINLGDVLIRAGRPQEAISEFQQAIRIKPDNALAEYNLARALVATGQTEEAPEHYREAVRLFPNYFKAHVDFGALLVRTGHPQEAIEEFHAALGVSPDDPTALNNLAVALMKTGRFSEAIEHTEHALQFAPDNPDAYSLMGLAWTQLGDIPQAIEQFQRALQLNANHITARHNLGVLLAKSGKTSEAIEQFQDELRLDPNNLSAYSSIAETLAIAGRFQEAQRAIQKAIEVARSTGQAELATQLEAKLKSYQAESGRASESPQRPTDPNR